VYSAPNAIRPGTSDFDLRPVLAKSYYRLTPELCDDSLALQGKDLRCRVSLSQVLNYLRHEMR